MIILEFVAQLYLVSRCPVMTLSWYSETGQTMPQIVEIELELENQESKSK